MQTACGGRRTAMRNVQARSQFRANCVLCCRRKRRLPMTIRLVTAAIIAAGLFALPAAAQLPRPGKDAAPKAAKGPAAAKQQPYTPIAVAEPKPFADADLAAFRKELAAVAGRKDRAALAKMVVDKDFFWMKEKGDGANKKKSGIDNLAQAANLAAKDGSGWQTLGDIAAADTAVPFADRKGVVCAPGGPQFDGAALDKLAQSTKTEMGDWAYPASNGVEVRESAGANAPVVDKLGMNLVRVMQSKGPSANRDFIQVVAPSGKVGFVSAEAVRPLSADQLCYSKDGGAWKIVGY